MSRACRETSAAHEILEAALDLLHAVSSYTRFIASNLFVLRDRAEASSPRRDDSRLARLRIFWPTLRCHSRDMQTHRSLRRAFIDATDALKSDTSRKHSHASRSGRRYGTGDNRALITTRRYCTSGFNVG